MDISALDKALSALESQISGVEQYVDGLEKWLWFSSFAVIVGVALEVYFVTYQYREDREDWRRGIVKLPTRPSSRILAGEIASIVLVVLGIAGELGIGILSSNANAKLRTLNNSRLELVRQKATDAITQAGDAKLSAKQAAEAADNATADAGKAKGTASAAGSLASAARKEAESFEKDIKDAKRDASEAKTLLAEVRQLATDAEVRAAMVEGKVADRHITPAQHARLVADLSKWTGIELPIVVINGDGEANAFGDELLKVLAVIPTWSLELTEQHTNSGMSGLFVRIDKEAKATERAFADDLVNALHAAGMQAGGPTLPPFRGTISGGGRSLLSGKFWPQSPMYDPTIRSRNHRVAIEVGVRP